MVIGSGKSDSIYCQRVYWEIWQPFLNLEVMEADRKIGYIVMLSFHFISVIFLLWMTGYV